MKRVEVSFSEILGKILHGECGPIVMASIDDLTW